MPGDARPVGVAALLGRLQRVVESGFAGERLWVLGELSGWRGPGRGGHRFFGLRDNEQRIACVMWRRDAGRLDASLLDEVEVVARGRIECHGGAARLVVSDLRLLDPVGAWRAVRERNRRMLEHERVLGREKRPLPPYPAVVALVVARESAARHDVEAGIQRRAPWIHIVLCDTRVQGSGAEADLVRAIGQAASRPGVELVVVARGGGAPEDLFAFDAPAVVRAIADCRVPTIVAVGHEPDETLACLAADVCAPTPSAAAALVCRRSAGELREGLKRTERLLCTRARRAAVGCGEILDGLDAVRVRGVRGSLRDACRVLEQLGSDALRRMVGAVLSRAGAALERFDTEDLCASLRQRLGRARRELEGAESQAGARRLEVLLEARHAELDGFSGRIADLSPASVLRRGYAVVCRRDGTVVRSVAAVGRDETVDVVLADGSLGVRVEAAARTGREESDG